MFKLDSEKVEEPEIKLPTSVGSSKKSSRKTFTSAVLTMPKPVTVWITMLLLLLLLNTVENSEREGNTRPPDMPLEKSV